MFRLFRFLPVMLGVFLLAGCPESPPEETVPAGRVLVLGFDGLDPDLLRQWVEAEKLPAFRKIIRDGVFSAMESVTPPLSPPAWSSAVTGVNQGKHGIYGFFRR